MITIDQESKRIAACRRCRKMVVHAKQRNGRDVTFTFPLAVLDSMRDLFDARIVWENVIALPHDETCDKLQSNQKKRKGNAHDAA